MSTANTTAKKWTCDLCGVSASRINGKPTALPDTWSSTAEGKFCLVCRRERAANAALESAPINSPLAARAQLRRAALIEFEVRRTPNNANNAIAKACRSSATAVAQARHRLQMPDPPPQSASRRG